MGDTDLVIRQQDRNAVHEIMMAHGFQNESQYEDREWVYYKNGMEFELHDHLVYEEDINEDKQTEFLNGFWVYVTDNKLDWNFHFIFLIFHLKKHFMNSGVGFRQFLDLAVVMDKIQLDWNWIEERLDEIELLSFAKVALSFCNRWFEVKAPIDLTEIDDEFYEEATEKIFKDGIFGFDNEENEQNYAVNLQRKQGKSGAVLKALRAVFPSYETLMGSSRYSFMKGKRYLLPAAWVYRIVSGVKRGHLSSGIEQTTKNFVSDEYKRKREELYRRWGI